MQIGFFPPPQTPLPYRHPGTLPANLAPTMHNLTVLTNSLALDRLTRLRDRHASRPEFSTRLRQLSLLLAAHAASELPLQPVDVHTPLESTRGAHLSGGITLVPILRAALGMMDAFQEIIPEARIGHLGFARNESTLAAELYLKRLPDDLTRDTVWLIDPMLATGHSAAAALDLLKQSGARSLRFICCLASPEGVNHLAQTHPDVPILTAALDRELNASGYILPGLGDAGDRQFGTGAA
ncbi:MAG: uracil phosphoribosyltransferase [Verrucomicrobiia bacterium]